MQDQRTYNVAVTVVVEVTASAANVVKVASAFAEELVEVARSDARWRTGAGPRTTGAVAPQRVSQVTLLGEAQR